MAKEKNTKTSELPIEKTPPESDEEFDSSSSSSSLDLEEEEKQEEDKRNQLADISIGDILKARAHGYRTSLTKPGHVQKAKQRRANKHRPMEMSSDVPVGRFREVIQAPKRVFRDPRFDSLSGNLDTDGFRKRYSFLFDVELPAEKEKLQKLIKKEKNQDVVKELKNHVSWIDKQMKSDVHKKPKSQILAEHIKKEREAAKRGKRPYYLTKSEIRERELIGKYNDLKASGKLESFIEKRRKRNDAKDHRYMPYRRTSENL